MNKASQWIEKIEDLLTVPLFELGGSPFTLWSLIYVVILIVVLFYAAGKIRTWMARHALARTKLDVGAREAVASITRYILLVLGLLIILQTAGINLTTFNVLAGAVGVGLGFGLQNIVSNFFSGLIIMFERPIKVGDRIVVDEIEGEVITVGARSTLILTNDNINIIVPNSKFITENVVNWKYNDDKVRLRIPIGVAYGSDLRKVEKILVEVAKAEDEVLDEPAPAVRFIEFGDSSLNFELRAWTSSAVDRKGRLISALNFAIHDRFVENEIEIPFPQRDLHIRSGALNVRTANRPGQDD
jgi:small-conductance mechanosensitive channel